MAAAIIDALGTISKSLLKILKVIRSENPISNQNHPKDRITNISYNTGKMSAYGGNLLSFDPQ